MYIFMVDYWLPFPSSEYGGLHCVVAQDEDECVKILIDSTNGWFKERYEDYAQTIAAHVGRAKRLRLDPSLRLQPGLVTEFLT